MVVDGKRSEVYGREERAWGCLASRVDPCDCVVCRKRFA